MIDIKYNLQEVSDYIVVPWLVLKDNVRKVVEVKESNLKHENMTKQTLGDAEEASAKSTGIWCTVIEGGRTTISVLPPINELFKLILPLEGVVQIHICLADIYIWL